MGMRFRKSINIVPGLKLNLNKNSVSLTAGTKGAHYTINSNGTHTTTVGLPGTGVYYTNRTNKSISEPNTFIIDESIDTEQLYKDILNTKCKITINDISVAPTELLNSLYIKEIEPGIALLSLIENGYLASEEWFTIDACNLLDITVKDLNYLYDKKCLNKKIDTAIDLCLPVYQLNCEYINYILKKLIATQSTYINIPSEQQSSNTTCSSLLICLVLIILYFIILIVLLICEKYFLALLLGWPILLLADMRYKENSI